MILSIGEILADMVGEKAQSGMIFKSFCGGAPFNVAVGAKNAGAKVGFVGRVGDDPVGRFLIGESKKANLEYMSVSQFKAFAKCEASALAEIKGKYTREKTTALLVGSYVDSYFEGTLANFIRENPEIFKKDGTHCRIVANTVSRTTFLFEAPAFQPCFRIIRFITHGNGKF